MVLGRKGGRINPVREECKGEAKEELSVYLPPAV
jgi:hypothetical protein